MIKCLIIDDEPLALDIIAKYVQQSEKLELVKKCSNALEAFVILEKQTIDLLFLDIKMPVISGIDFIKSLQKPPAVIFTTAFSEFAAGSYEMEAVDYLLKPVTFARFGKSIDKYLIQNNIAKTAQKNYLYIKADARLQKVLYDDILYAESMRDYVKFVTKKEIHVTHMTMKTLADILPSDMFLRVHRSFFVNVMHLSIIGKKELKINQIRIPIGENFKENIRNLK